MFGGGKVHQDRHTPIAYMVRASQWLHLVMRTERLMERTRIGTMPTAYIGGFTAANHSLRWRSLLAPSVWPGVLPVLAEVGADVLALAAGRCTAAACLCCSSKRPTSPYKFGCSWPARRGRSMIRQAEAGSQQ